MFLHCSVRYKFFFRWKFPRPYQVQGEEREKESKRRKTSTDEVRKVKEKHASSEYNENIK